MFYLFTVIFCACFLMGQEYGAVGFAILLVGLPLLMAFFFCMLKNRRNILPVLPIILLSLSAHVSLFLIELTKDFIKNVNIWVLLVLLLAVCGLIAWGTRAKSGITAVTNMCAPLFFLLVIVLFFPISAGSISEPNKVALPDNPLTLLLCAASGISTAASLVFMHPCGYRKSFNAYFAAVVLFAGFTLFNQPFFRAIALNLTVPLLISVQLLVLKEAFLYPEQNECDVA